MYWTTDSGSSEPATGAVAQAHSTPSPTMLASASIQSSSPPEGSAGPVGAGVLDGDAHQRVDQFLEHDLAGDRLRNLDHGRQIEVFDRRAIVLIGPTSGFRPQLRMEPIELPYLALGAPAQVAGAGVVAGRRRAIVSNPRAA